MPKRTLRDLFAIVLDSPAEAWSDKGMDATTTSLPEYEQTAHCRDLPELVDVVDGEVSLTLPESGLERIAAAVAARRAPGAVLQEKIDGCWAALAIGPGGRVESVTSRAGLHLRVAVGWIGERVHRLLEGWTLVGEVECGTAWASAHRDEDPIPRLHLYAAFDRQGRRVAGDRVRGLVLRHAHPRIVYIHEAGPRDDWAAWTRTVIEAGGEGVVIREANGATWRAKPRQTVDRVVSRVYTQADHNGQHRAHADLAVMVGGRLRRAQTVLVPEALQGELRRGTVVVVVGASVDQATGVVRHARIVDARPRDEKQPAECTM